MCPLGKYETSNDDVIVVNDDECKTRNARSIVEL